MLRLPDSPRRRLALANRILVRQGVLDAFGHVSPRNPDNADLFFLARSVGSELVIEDDILLFDADSQSVTATDVPLYSERVIHGTIYQARSDVAAVRHHHAPAIPPFCLADLKLRVVTQLGATIGTHVPL